MFDDYQMTASQCRGELASTNSVLEMLIVAVERNGTDGAIQMLQTTIDVAKAEVEKNKSYLKGGL